MPVSTNTTTASPSPAPAGARFVLYALQGRVYASNVRHKLVDLGRLSQEGDGGTYAYLLDGDQATGSGFAGAREALAHIARTTSFLFLDGQFTALEDLGGTGRPDLADAPRLAVALDPLGRGAPVIHAPA
ncbi:hypothetical protein KW843_26425 [Acidovorax sp. sif1233]|uniref:hypothetical protein n=1 Tax=unclassified Acidovorax TaxID=2684926 RepID=UPI001C4466EC|nr:hypothetical protein [Acidovorax sp. sif1233]MBV7458034.1 hypothetical protein [Acidovorax sp. sif1233]